MEFLYRNNQIGIIDDSEPIDWFMSEEYNSFLIEMRSSTPIEFVEKLISIFVTEIPNLHRLFEGIGNKIKSHTSTIEVTEILRDDITSLNAVLQNSNNYQTLSTINIHMKQDLYYDLLKSNQLRAYHTINGEHIYKIIEPCKMISIIYNSESHLLSIHF